MDELIKELGEALSAALDHLESCGYGEDPFHDIAYFEKLPSKLEQAKEKCEAWKSSHQT